MKKIWILNHHSGLKGDRHYELAKEMAETGLEVFIFLSSFDHVSKVYRYDKEVVIQRIQDGVTYVWLHTSPAYHGNGAARILNMMDYSSLMNKYEKKFYERFG